MKHPTPKNIHNNNRIVVSLSKVSYAWSGWITTCGNYRRRLKPQSPTVHGQEFDCEAPCFSIPCQIVSEKYNVGVYKETMLLRATRLKVLDTWIPYTTLQLSNSHSLTYIGDKAISIMKEWSRRQFNKKEK